MAFKITIEPMSNGATEEDRHLKPGDGTYASTPASLRTIFVDATAAQIVGLQGYLVKIKAGSDTSSVETAITAITPT
jgi:hypothetical protein